MYWCVMWIIPSIIMSMKPYPPTILGWFIILNMEALSIKLAAMDGIKECGTSIDIVGWLYGMVRYSTMPF